MMLKSSTTRYGAVAASIHWLSALAVILLLASGQAMDWADGQIGAILPVHVVLGVLVGLLTLFRIVWWLAFDRKPQSLPTISRRQQLAARLVHLGLYIALVVMVASGIAMLALRGAAPQIFANGVLPDFSALAPFAAHSLVSKLLLVLVLGHIGAALWHHFGRKDGLIGRMRFGA